MGKGKQEEVGTEATFPLDEEEIELLQRVLQKHRTTLPSYLLSMKREIETIDRILSKLSSER